MGTKNTYKLSVTASDKGVEINIDYPDELDPLILSSLLHAVTSGRLTEQITQIISSQVNNNEDLVEVLNMWKTMILKDARQLRGILNAPVVRPSEALRMRGNNDEID